MKELSIEQKAQRYDEAIRKAKITLGCCDSASIITEHTIYDIFPELKESEDERIRKELITHCRNIRCVTEEGAERIAKWIAWLEKQGEQNLANSYCQEHCKGFQETGKCFADGDCKAKTIAETVHAGTENILNELASRIESAEIVNVRQVLEWIDKQTKE